MSIKRTLSVARILSSNLASRIKSSTLASKLSSSTTASSIKSAIIAARLQASIVLGIFIQILNFRDSAGVSDQETKTLDTSKSDSSSANDQPRKGFGKALDELIELKENVITGLAKLLSDSASADDDTQVGLGKSLSDTFTANDTIQPFQFGKNLDDTIRATDDVGGEASVDDDQTIAFFKVTGDIAGASDNLSRVAVFSREFTDDFATSDQHSIGFGRLPSESLATADTATKDIGTNIVERLRYISHYVHGHPIYAFGIPDEQFKDFGKALFDGYSVDDSLTRTVFYNRAFTDQVGVTDDVNGAAVDDDQTISYFKNTTDTLVSDDNFSKVVAYSRSPSDSSGADDSLDRDVSKPFVDKPSVADLYVANFARPVSDEASTSDNFNKAVSYQRSPTDSIKATDDVNGAAVDDDQTIQFIKVTNDSAGTSDDFSRVVSFQRDLDDSSGVSDQPSKSLSVTRTDRSFVQDALSKVLAFARSLSDSGGASDEITNKRFGKLAGDASSADDALQFGLNTSKSDTAGVDDNFSSATSFSRSFFEKVSALDDVNGAAVDDDQTIQFFKVLSESSSVEDSEVKSTGKDLGDGVSASDSGSFIVQGYTVDNTYFANDYVGSSGSF